MSEPTKEQIEEARVLRNRFLPNEPDAILWWLPLLIAHVRTQATNDALERVAFLCNCVANDYAVADDHLPTEMMRSASTGAEKCADEIRAMKVPT